MGQNVVRIREGPVSMSRALQLHLAAEAGT